MPIAAIHPGEHLAKELQALDMSAAELAQFWLNLQNLYDLRLAQRKAGKSVQALPRLKRRELVHA